MNTAKSHALAYLGIGVSLISFSFLARGWTKLSLVTLGIVFLLAALLFVSSLRFRSRWLVKVVEFMGKIHVSHLTLFLVLYGLAIRLIQQDLVLAGIIVVYAAYIALALAIGRQLGSEVLQPLLAKRDKAM